MHPCSWSLCLLTSHRNWLAAGQQLFRPFLACTRTRARRNTHRMHAETHTACTQKHTPHARRNTHTPTRTPTHANRHAEYIHAHMLTHTHTHPHTHAEDTHAHIHMVTHTQVHTHACLFSFQFRSVATPTHTPHPVCVRHTLRKRNSCCVYY